MTPPNQAQPAHELVAFRVQVPFPESGPLVSCDELGEKVTPPPRIEVPPQLVSQRVIALPEQSVGEAVNQPVSDGQPTGGTEPAGRAEPADRAEPAGRVERASENRTGSNPIVQSLTLIVSMVVMLLIARFSVPRIVEEIRYSWHRGELRAEYETGGEGLQNVSLDSLSRAYGMVTSTVGPSVVHIDVRRKPTPKREEIHHLLGDQLFGTSDQGSGVVVDADGYVLTNRHVIADGASISVMLSDGRRLPASVVGTDALTDLAVLKVNADRLMPIKWGDSDALRVGSPVWAVGSPFGLDRTVTFGILSGKNRWVQAGEQHGANAHYQDFMQSDVAVNPGNSGGPLVDAKGTLVGINTAIVGDTYRGVSFSIPSNLSRQVYESIRKAGRVQRGYLGVGLQEVPDEMLIGENTRVRGALVSGIAGEGSPAGIAGVRAGDVVQRADGVEVADSGHLMRIVGSAGAEVPVILEVRRDGEVLQLTVMLGNRPFELDR